MSLGLRFRALNLFRISDFGFRIWNFVGISEPEPKRQNRAYFDIRPLARSARRV
jgi:hypothetical protein